MTPSFSILLISFIMLLVLYTIFLNYWRPLSTLQTELQWGMQNHENLYAGGLISFASSVIFFIYEYIRHIWMKPVLCSRMVSLFHHTSPWTRKCLQSSPSAHRNGRVFRRSVQTACCYWILNRGKSSSNWNSQMNASRLWWTVCRWEYSKTLGKAVKRWRIGGKKIWVTKHEMEGVWLQVVSFIKIALKNWSAKSVASNKKKLPLHENF